MLKQANSFVSPSTAQSELIEMLIASGLEFDIGQGFGFIDVTIGGVDLEFDRDGHISAVISEGADESDVA